MTRIAIAGGTGSLGLTFLSALSAGPAKHDIHILTRSPPPSSPPPITGPQISYHQVSYDSADALATFLTTHAITLVISTITIDSPTTSRAQQTLIAAASLSPSVTHLIPSEYGFPCSAALLALAPPWEHWAANAAALKAASKPQPTSTDGGNGNDKSDGSSTDGKPTTGFRYLRIQTGWFMDYFGMPHVPTHLTPFPWAVDAARLVAALPGTGDQRVSMTATADLARYVAWLAEHLDAWPITNTTASASATDDGDDGDEDAENEVFLVGDDEVTLRALVSWVASARGRRFARIECDSEEKLRRGEVTWFEGQERPTHAHWFAMFGLMACLGLMDLSSVDGDRGSGRRRKRVDTRALEGGGWEMRKVREFVEEAWTGR